jgi:RNA polymerase sigma factor (sigma-70 family)
LSVHLSSLVRGWISDRPWYNPENGKTPHWNNRQGSNMTEPHEPIKALVGLDVASMAEVSNRDEDDWDDTSAPAPKQPVTAERFETESLEILISRVMRQDEEALASLYSLLSAPVFSLAMRITRNIASSEEVLQDVFWQVWRQAPRFDRTRGSVPAWVLTITRSRALDAIRSQMRTPQAKLSDIDEMTESLPSPDAGPQDLLLAAQQGSRLKSALETLDPLRRQLVSLSFYRGLTQQEIAEQTGLPLGTVKSHLRRSMVTLREALGADFVVAPA